MGDAAALELAEEDPEGPAGRMCLAGYAAELRRRIPGGFDPGASLLADPRALGVFLIARLDGVPVGCGGLKLAGDVAELKRVWLADGARGLGLGRRLVAELEDRARARGVRTLRLDTNRALAEAIALYRSTGWVEVPAFNAEPFADHWFEKDLSI